MFKKIALGLLISAHAAGSFAQALTNIQANPSGSAYLQDSRGVIVRGGFGLCWRSGPWTAADATPGCDGELTPPIALKATAPEIVPKSEVAAPAKTVAPAVAAVAPPKRCDFSLTLENDQTFAFNRTFLTESAKKRIDEQVLGQLAKCAKIDIVIVTGHTDRLGSQQYNQKLSDQRAEIVAAYIKSKGITASIDTLGVGKTQPIKACSDKLDHKKLIECLAPNRRVVVEGRGLAQ